MFPVARQSTDVVLVQSLPTVDDILAGQLATTEPLSETAVWKIVTGYAEQCGLAHIKPHGFRRFVGTQLAAKDIRKAQVALGHKSIEITARHYVLDELEVGLTDHLY